MKKQQLFKPIRLFTLVFLLVSSMTSCNANQSKTEKSMEQTAMKSRKIKDNKGKSYSIIFLTINNEEGYNKYRKATEKLMKNAGGHIEREFDVMGQKGNIPDFEAPNRVVVIYWDAPNGHEQLLNNEKYMKSKELLESSTSNIRVVKGTSEMSQTSESDDDGRMYLLKISYYKENTEGRVEMLKEIGPKLSPYGFYTERMIMVNEAVGFDTPSEVTVHFHDQASQNEELQKDESVTSAIGAYNSKYLTHFVYLPLKLR